jgi:Glyoxalase-like domain
MATSVQITFDCADPAALAHFWSEALGYVVQPPPEGFDTWEDLLRALDVPRETWDARSAAVDPDGAGPRLFFQRVPEGKTVKNRLHLDLHVGGQGSDRMQIIGREAARLERLGATPVRRVEPDGRLEAGFITMQDPEGNEFCVD